MDFGTVNQILEARIQKKERIEKIAEAIAELVLFLLILVFFTIGMIF